MGNLARVSTCSPAGFGRVGRLEALEALLVWQSRAVVDLRLDPAFRELCLEFIARSGAASDTDHELVRSSAVAEIGKLEHARSGALVEDTRVGGRDFATASEGGVKPSKADAEQRGVQSV